MNWAPRLVSEDLYSAYILAAATRKPPAARRAGTPDRSADPLAAIGHTAHLKGDAQPLSRATMPPADPSTAGNDAGYLGDPWGLLGIQISGATAGSQVVVRITVDEFAEPTEATFTLARAGDFALYPRIRYRYDRLRALPQTRPVVISWSVSLNGRPAGTHTLAARLHPLKAMPQALRTDRGAESLAWVVAGYVTEDAPWIDALLKDAFKDGGSGAVGYSQGESAVHQQVAVIYDHLRRQGLRFDADAALPNGGRGSMSQPVRFPSESVRPLQQASGIDGVVLMASILRRIGIEPLIVLGPDRALLGYYPQANAGEGFVVIDTTLLATASFSDAASAGKAAYRAWQALPDANDTALRRVPVYEARLAGVMPLSR